MQKVTIIEMTAEELSQLIENVVQRVIRTELLSNKAVRVGPELEILMTIQAAAEFLNLTVPTIYSLTSRHLIPFMKRGKKLYFSRKELTEYVKSGRNKTVNEVEACAEVQLKKIGLTNI